MERFVRWRLQSNVFTTGERPSDSPANCPHAASRDRGDIIVLRSHGGSAGARGFGGTGAPGRGESMPRCRRNRARGALRTGNAWRPGFPAPRRRLNIGLAMSARRCPRRLVWIDFQAPDLMTWVQIPTRALPSADGKAGVLLNVGIRLGARVRSLYVETRCRLGGRPRLPRPTPAPSPGPRAGSAAYGARRSSRTVPRTSSS